MKTSTRNWWSVFLDYVFFGVGLTFAHVGTVLPSFAATLTTSNVLIGLVGAVWLGSWLLPQMFAANFLSNKPRKYHYMVIGAALGRPMFWIFAVLLLTGWLAQWPMVMLVLFLAGLAWFLGTDAFVAIAWFDLFGKAMSPGERGRLIGIGQVVNGLLAIGAGALVAYLLSEEGLPYPANYAAIFGLAGLAFFLSWVAIVWMVELPEAVPEQPMAASLAEFWPKIVELWRNDPIFARAISVRLLVGLGDLAAPFYILHATQVTRIGAEVVGSLAAVGSIGATLAGLWLGRVAARQGSQRVIQITSWLSILPPVLGLVAAFAPGLPVLVWLYIGCYLILGMVNGSSLLGYFNYILDLAPQGGRPVYMGVANTLSGLLVFAPIAGGWILDYSSYPVLFTITLVGMFAAALSAINLPPVRHRFVEPIREIDLPLP